ncbi:hypothetical protein [Streptomyces sp. NPDC059994]|uniref:hypothetical protein n=1 Tax=Streptomyces sp. NPDC059994 TaxID=3347029 RepID=UPI0036B5E91A
MASFSDDFNRANSTDLGASWVEVSGDWSILSNQLSPGAAGGTIILRAASTMASNDHYAQATIAATTAASQGVWCRGNANITSGYLWRNNGTSWDLFRVVGGSFTAIGTYAAAAAPGDIARVQAVGSTITAYVGGIQRVSVTDTAVTTGTSVGIRADSAGALRFDDFTAADLSAGATLTTAAATETAQVLAGGKAAALGLAAATHAAQPVTGAKAAPLGTGATTEAAQALAGVKTAALDAAAAVEAAQQVADAKTGVLGAALEAGAAQAVTGVKTEPLLAAAQAETAQPLAAEVSHSLPPAAAVGTAQPLAGVKSAALGPAQEAAAAGPLTAGGLDLDLDITVGVPHAAAWNVQTPLPGWGVGAPC